MPPAALALCAARLAGMAPCPLQRDGRAPHRARSTSCFVPIRRAGSRPAFAGADASVCHGASRSLPHVRRRDRDGVYFGQPAHDRTTPDQSQPTPRSRCPSPQHQPPRNNQVEQMLWLNPSLLRCYSVRPIFLGCCVLAVKVSREGDTSICCLLSRVQDVFNLLDATLLSRCHTAFENRAPAPGGAQLAACPYSPTASTSHLFAPQPCVRQCGAGAGLADAHGRRATSSLRRRALRRGSGRAPRAAHAGRELELKAQSRAKCPVFCTRSTNTLRRVTALLNASTNTAPQLRAMTEAEQVSSDHHEPEPSPITLAPLISEQPRRRVRCA